MTRPDVSVVMSVYNAEAGLPRTVGSVLAQQACDFEFIVVDDGSTDSSGRILDELARDDSRLCVVHQANTGLTRALIRGCTLARGEFIARHDADDASRPGRLAQQMHFLRTAPQHVAVSCQTEFIGPKGEFLYRTRTDETTLNGQLGDTSVGLQGPPHHGSVMMRASTYRDAGGYRDAFYFAQDLDLWARLAERGRFGLVDEPLYVARLAPASISGSFTREQSALAALITRAAAARRAGLDEAPYLEAARAVRRIPEKNVERRLAQGNYFIASCLRASAPEAAYAYYRQALRHDPSHWRAWVRCLQYKVGC
jgi:glycosyltransferase involved in cell wall biosynthesis